MLWQKKKKRKFKSKCYDKKKDWFCGAREQVYHLPYILCESSLSGQPKKKCMKLIKDSYYNVELKINLFNIIRFIISNWITYNQEKYDKYAKLNHSALVTYSNF